jgi:hypothetical protein
MLEPVNYQVQQLPIQEDDVRRPPESRAGEGQPPTQTKKALYREFCAGEKTLPIYSRDWWLDASAGEENWDVALVENNGRVIAALPYAIEKRLGFTLLTLPPFTKMLGPWIREGTGKYAKRLAQQKDLMEALIDQLPRYDHYAQNWHYSQTNWLPFYWRGFNQTTRYTYLLEGLSDMDTVVANFENSKRANIRKARERVEVVYDIPAREFYDNHCLTLAKKGARIDYSWDEFRRIHAACYAHNAGKTIAAYDQCGNLHAALFVIWDEMSAYAQICTIDPDYLTHGAASLLNQEIIAYVADKTRTFDFEGSMIESVERSFRQYGATQTAYFAVSRTPSRLLKTLLFLKDLK